MLSLRSGATTIRSFGLFAFAIGGLLAVPAHAATSTASFPVTATVQASCVISAAALAFGTYTGVQADGSSTVTVTCTNSTTYNVGLNEGIASGATVATRQMTAGAATLNYALFRDASRRLNWGTTVSADTLAGTGNGSAQSLTVYGRVSASQFVDPGAYSDTITATITY